MPQVWKSSLAIDWNVPTEFPMTLTAEGIFNKTIHGVPVLWNWNINESAVDQPLLRSGQASTTTNGNYLYGTNNAYVLTNSNEGWG